MENEDIFDMLDNGTDISKVDKKEKPQVPKERTEYNPNWSNRDIEPVKLSRDNLVTAEKCFTLVTSYRTEQLSETSKNKITKVLSYIGSHGNSMVYRNMTSGTDTLAKEWLSSFENKECYLPWRNFNKDIKNCIIFQPTELAYRVASSYHKNYIKLPDIIRTILACKVHTVLGKSCKEPVKFILAYSDCGSETFKKDMDWKQLGDLGFYIRMSKELSIPFINIANPDFSAEKLNKLINI